MIFFDRKEEVLEIELTSFGRHKLSKGEFEPVFYSFFDDDVVYELPRLYGDPKRFGR